MSYLLHVSQEQVNQQGLISQGTGENIATDKLGNTNTINQDNLSVSFQSITNKNQEKALLTMHYLLYLQKCR